jgi:endonuclease YncB( thermonuclease family)
MKRFYIILLLFLINSCRQQSINNGLSGIAVNIPDGDTFTLLTSENKSIRIRLYGIDAPERGQDFYQASKKYLGDLLQGQNLNVQVRDTDQYKRIVGDVYLPGKRHVNKAMVEAGLAWHYKQFSKDENLAVAEEQAKEKRIGLWKQPNARPPWEWRKEKRIKKKKGFYSHHIWIFGTIGNPFIIG